MIAFIKSRRQNYALLRDALAVVGPEFERRPYDELRDRPAEVLSFVREFGGFQLAFSAEASEELENGDIAFWIDASGLPTFPYPGPSWRFFKRPDGSVYH